MTATCWRCSGNTQSAKGISGGCSPPRDSCGGSPPLCSWEAFFGLGQRKPPRPRRRHNLRILRFRASPKAQSLRCSSFPPHKHACAADRVQPAYLSNLRPVSAPAQRARVVQPDGLLTSWEAFFGLGQRKPPRPRKESRFGWFNMPGSACYSAVRHRYVGIPKIYARLGCHLLTSLTSDR